VKVREMTIAIAPDRFLRPGDGDPFDTDALSVEFGYIDGQRVVYEQGPDNWSAYSLDLPGLIATGATRAEVERRMREALPDHLALSDEPLAPAANSPERGDGPTAH
jgi:predicted RNase H-like HicB family nuclease